MYTARGVCLLYSSVILMAAGSRAECDASDRLIEFSGYQWHVKASTGRVGPGPNYFSNRADDVWIDASGRLHLRIAYRDGRWHSTEVYTESHPGYGTYTFTLASRVDRLDRNIVLGLFTWDDFAPEFNYREIDIEVSRWGDPEDQNAQFVVQPWQPPENMHRFDVALTGDYSTHRFDWRAAEILFSSFRGVTSPPLPADVMASWSYTGSDVPPPGAGAGEDQPVAYGRPSPLGRTGSRGHRRGFQARQPFLGRFPQDQFPADFSRRSFRISYRKWLTLPHRGRVWLALTIPLTAVTRAPDTDP